MKFKDVELFVFSHSFFSHKTLWSHDLCPYDKASCETVLLGGCLLVKLRFKIFFVE